MTAPLDALRALLMKDVALQNALGSITDAAEFARRAASIAAAAGIALDADTIAQAARGDPAGIARFLPAPANATAWPPAGWLPVHVAAQPHGVFVDWAWFGEERMEAFHGMAARRALHCPFNRLVRWRMTLNDFVRGADATRPTGLVFHMSRCGSTWVARMLGALDGSFALSEPQALDGALQVDYLLPSLPQDEHAALIGALLCAFARGARRSFVKLDPWHALRLPLLRRAAPDVPFVFLMRDPAAVLASQMRDEGAQLYSGVLLARAFAIAGFETMPEDELFARALGKICAAAVQNMRAGDLLVDYSELPGAVAAKILPHFGVTQSARDAVSRVAREHAKKPGMAFTPDSAAKQREASPLLRALAQEHVAAAYAQLEAMAKA